MLLLDAAVALCLYQFYRVLIQVSGRDWNEVKDWARGMSIAVGVAGALFYLSLLLHIFR